MHIIFVGKGPLKGYYESIIQSKQMSHVEIFTLWLSAEDYPVLLGMLLLCGMHAHNILTSCFCLYLSMGYYFGWL